MLSFIWPNLQLSPSQWRGNHLTSRHYPNWHQIDTKYTTHDNNQYTHDRLKGSGYPRNYRCCSKVGVAVQQDAQDLIEVQQGIIQMCYVMHTALVYVVWHTELYDYRQNSSISRELLKELHTLTRQSLLCLLRSH